MNVPDGQLLTKERELLYSMIISHKPERVFEVGTGYGGGSTYQIYKALASNGSGILVTSEENPECFKVASEFYKDSGIVRVRHRSSEEIIGEFIESGEFPDFLFFDGKEDPDVAINDIIRLEKHMKVGSIFMCHDWDPQHGGVKAQKIRPYMEASHIWKPIAYLTAPESVGLICMEKVA